MTGADAGQIQRRESSITRLDDEAVDRPALFWRTCQVQAIKVGFVAAPNTSTIAETATDSPVTPAIAYTAQPFLVASQEPIVIPGCLPRTALLRTSVSAGNATARCGAGRRPCSSAPQPHPPRHCPRGFRDWARPTPWSLAFPCPSSLFDNVLATPQTILGSNKFELFVDAHLLRRGPQPVGRATAWWQRQRPERSHQRSPQPPLPPPDAGFGLHGPQSLPLQRLGPAVTH